MSKWDDYYFSTTSPYFADNMVNFQNNHVKDGDVWHVKVMTPSHEEYKGIIFPQGSSFHFKGEDDDELVDLLLSKYDVVLCNPNMVIKGEKPTDDIFLTVQSHLHNIYREKYSDVEMREYGISYMGISNGRKRIHELHIDVNDDGVDLMLLVPTDVNFDPVKIDLADVMMGI